MNTLVVLFFVSNVLAAGLLGGKFLSKQEPVFRYFGIGLLFDAAAFAFWFVSGGLSHQGLTPLSALLYTWSSQGNSLSACPVGSPPPGIFYFLFFIL